MREVISEILRYVSLAIGLLGVLIIVWGVLRTFLKAVSIELSKNAERRTTKERQGLRRQLSSYLLLGLEILIASDLIRTMIHPTLKQVAVLGSIVAVRTVISFFLNRETRE